MKPLHLSCLAAVVAWALTSPAFAQHAGHREDSKKTPRTEAEPTASSQNVNPHDGMDHSTMDHGDDTANAASPGPEMETAPPPEAGSGPPRAADAVWGADVMQAARHKEHGKHGDFPVLWVQADRFELQSHAGKDSYLWDVQGYYGGTTSRLWFKSEGEGGLGEKPEEAEVQALWSKAIDPFWDLQLGLRQDVAGGSRTHAVIGVHGLAPYMFEVDGALFVSHRGDITAKVEAEVDQRVTQRLILQPRIEIGLSAQDIPSLGVGRGIDQAEIGVRLRYEFIREFAPYIGVEQSWRIGNGADFARLAGEDRNKTKLVMGIRFWF